MSKSRKVEIEFEYEHPTEGVVAVEALYTVQKPDFYSKESDWDYNGFQDLEHYAVFKNGTQILVDIPDDVMYHHLREHLRNAEIEGCFHREEEF